jgi:hypothetical protein
VADAQQGSPEWWRDRLLVKLSQQAARVRRLEKYYDGEHPLPVPPRGLSDQVFEEACRAFRMMSAMGVTNWVRLVPDAPSERLSVVGFRFGESTGADSDAWAIWQRNELDADSALVQDNALQTGQSYVLVWGDDNGDPLITCEHSSQMIVAYAPGSRRKRIAALKSWDDDLGMRFCVLYLPGALYKWSAKTTVVDTWVTTDPNTPWAGSVPYTPPPEPGLSWEQWQPASDPSWPLPNPLGVVPVVEFRANPKLRARPFGGGQGEMEAVLSIQDRINKTIFDRLVTAEHQAFRQRWTIGWEPPIDEETGEPDKRYLFRASQARLWTFDGDPNEIKIGEFGQADFAPFIAAVESDVNAMAAITKTPPQYLLGAMINISGDALVAAESGLVMKVAKHATQFGESWEEVLRLALAVAEDPRATDEQTMVLWREFEVRSWAETVDAVLKMRSLDVPLEVLWSMLPGVSPQDVERWKTLPPPPPPPALPPPPLPKV